MKEFWSNNKLLETVATHNFPKWMKKLKKEWTDEWNHIQIRCPDQK